MPLAQANPNTPHPRLPLNAWWVTQAGVNEPFDRQRQIDPFGHRVHTAFACLACLCVTGPTSVVELGAIPVLCAFLIRFHRHWRTLPRLFLQPVILVVLLWTALALTSRLWTHTPLSPHNTWVDEFGALRFGYLLIALWPVADRRTLLLGAIALGFALGQLTQLGHALGLALDIDWLTWNRLPGRNSGWWDPVVGGSLLTAALGLHLPAALWGKGLWRILGVIGSGATLLGILATGTRGAWLAAFGLVGLALLTALVRIKLHRRAGFPARVPKKKMLPAAATLLTVLILGCTIAWLTLGEQLHNRYSTAHTEITNAIEHKQFQSDTGARLLMNWWAIEAALEHPITGTGVGGYEAWTRAHTAEQGIDPATRNHHAHAHNALLHAAATLGIPGLLLAVLFITLALTGSAHRQPGDGPPGYADGPSFALLGLLLVSAFDTIHVNAQTAALLAALLLFAMQTRPSPCLSPSPLMPPGRRS